MFGDRSYIVYDGECPFCSQYVKLLRLRESVGPVELVSARENHPIVRYLEERGVVLDQDMAFVSGDQVYVGPDCVNRLALLSTSSGLFNFINAHTFSSPLLSRALYPMLRRGRWLALWALRRQRL